MNNWSFTGNLGNNAEVKVTAAGKTVCEFSVAVRSGYGDKAKTTWVRCTLFGKRAEGGLVEYLIKGAQVAITGEASLDEWENNGVTNKMLKVFVNDLDLIGGRPEPAPTPQPQQQAPQPALTKQQTAPGPLQQAPNYIQQPNNPAHQAPPGAPQAQPYDPNDPHGDGIPFS